MNLYPYYWRVKTRLPERYGQFCKVLSRGKMNTCLVEFESDKYKVVTSRNYVRKIKMKECSTCKEPKSFSEFYKNKSAKNGLSSDCKACSKLHAKQWQIKNPEKARERVKKWRANHPERVKANSERWYARNILKKRDMNRKYREANRDKELARSRKGNLLRKYGITEDDFLKILDQQGGKCAICGTDKPGGVGKFHVDHSHETGEIRGLLCNKCNRVLGLINDDSVIASRIIEYLSRNYLRKVN